MTLAGFHSLNYSMFELAREYGSRGMAAYSELQQKEFAAEGQGLHRDAPSARGRHRLLRSSGAGHRRWQRIDDGLGRVDRSPAVSLDEPLLIPSRVC